VECHHGNAIEESFDDVLMVSCGVQIEISLRYFISVADPDPGSGIQDRLKSGSGILEKNPGSATLTFTWNLTKFGG
jgi:hypothetical protein